MDGGVSIADIDGDGTLDVVTATEQDLQGAERQDRRGRVQQPAADRVGAGLDADRRQGRQRHLHRDDAHAEHEHRERRPATATTRPTFVFRTGHAPGAMPGRSSTTTTSAPGRSTTRSRRPRESVRSASTKLRTSFQVEWSGNDGQTGVARRSTSTSSRAAASGCAGSTAPRPRCAAARTRAARRPSTRSAAGRTASGSAAVTAPATSATSPRRSSRRSPANAERIQPFAAAYARVRLRTGVRRSRVRRCAAPTSRTT